MQSLPVAFAQINNSGCYQLLLATDSFISAFFNEFLLSPQSFQKLPLKKFKKIKNQLAMLVKFKKAFRWILKP